MNFNWEIEDGDIAKVQALLDTQRDDPFVRSRIERNLADKKALPTKEQVWWSFVACRVTSQQRSGPTSPVSRLLSVLPFPLDHDKVASQTDRQSFIEATIKANGGIRFSTAIALDLATNLERLEVSEWQVLMDHLDGLRHQHDAALEREVADYLAATFRGLGPKQSRNLIQSLGLALYEIPIDSRITKWLNGFGFPVRLTSGALGDRAYYEFVSDGVQALARACNVYPCVLDAAIFSSFDKGGWTEDQMIW